MMSLSIKSTIKDYRNLAAAAVQSSSTGRTRFALGVNETAMPRLVLGMMDFGRRESAGLEENREPAILNTARAVHP
jgi:hypothetical protein